MNFETSHNLRCLGLFIFRVEEIFSPRRPPFDLLNRNHQTSRFTVFSASPVRISSWDRNTSRSSLATVTKVDSRRSTNHFSTHRSLYSPVESRTLNLRSWIWLLPWANSSVGNHQLLLTSNVFFLSTSLLEILQSTQLLEFVNSVNHVIVARLPM